MNKQEKLTAKIYKQLNTDHDDLIEAIIQELGNTATYRKVMNIYLYEEYGTNNMALILKMEGF